MAESSPKFELLCIVLLGFGQMCIMTGYDTQSFVLESVIHSIYEREPTRINPYAGYFGQAVCYASYMFACIFTPTLMNLIGPKLTLFIGSLCYTMFQIGFFFLNSYYYFFASALMGVGFALFYTGHGGYLTSHSSRPTLEANSSIAWSIGCFCMIVGGGILAAVFTLTSDSGKMVDALVDNVTSVIAAHQQRTFSDRDIYLMYAAFTAVTLLANVTFLLIPSKEVENCIEGKDKKTITFVEQMRLMYQTFASKKVSMLALLFVTLGVWTSFWISVYPTTLMFNMHLADQTYLPAIYSIGVGIGEIIMGFMIAVMSKRVKDFGLQPTMTLGCIMAVVALGLITVTTPKHAPLYPTHEEPLFFQPSQLLVFFVSLLIGMADSCLNNVRTVICAIVMPHRRPQAFSISKFYQAFGGAVLLALSPKLTIYHYTIVLLLFTLLSTALFFRVARKTQRMERKVTMEQLSRNQVPL